MESPLSLFGKNWERKGGVMGHINFWMIKHYMQKKDRSTMSQCTEIGKIVYVLRWVVAWLPQRIYRRPFFKHFSLHDPFGTILLKNNLKENILDCLWGNKCDYLPRLHFFSDFSANFARVCDTNYSEIKSLKTGLWYFNWKHCVLCDVFKNIFGAFPPAALKCHWGGSSSEIIILVYCYCWYIP